MLSAQPGADSRASILLSGIPKNSILFQDAGTAREGGVFKPHVPMTKLGMQGLVNAKLNEARFR